MDLKKLILLFIFLLSSCVNKLLLTEANKDELPLLTELEDQFLNEGSIFSYDFNDKNTGLDKDANGDTLSYTCFFDSTVNNVKEANALSCDILPGTASFSITTGTLIWKPSYSAFGVYEVWIEASDGKNSDTKKILYTINDTPARAELGPIPDVFVNEGIAISQIDVNDDGDDFDADLNAISYQCKYDIVIDGSVSSPADCSDISGLSFNTSSGLLDWIPGQQASSNGSQSGKYEFKVIGTSPGGSGEVIFVVTVNLVDVAPELKVFLDQSIGLNTAFSGIDNEDVTSNNDFDADGDAISYSCSWDSVDNEIEDLVNPCTQNGFTFNSFTGILSGTPDTIGTYEFHITGSEGDKSDNFFFTVTVSNCIWKSSKEFFSAPVDNSCYEKIASNHINDIKSDSTGKLYVATVGGLSISTDGGITFTTKTISDGIGINYIRRIFIDSNDDVYLATGEGVSISRDGGQTFTHNIVNGLGTNGYNTGSVAVDSSGIIFAAGWGLGVYVSNDGGISYVNKNTSDGLGSNTTNDVFIDSNDKVYIATTSGISISSDSGTSFTNITGNGLNHSNIRSVYVDSLFKIYVMTGSSLCSSINAGSSFSCSSPSGGGRINSDATGNIYVGSYSSGYYFSSDNGATFTNKTIVDGLLSNTVSFVYKDPLSSKTYAGAFDGISVSTDNGNSFTSSITTQHSLGFHDIISMYVDQSDNIYLGSYSSGLASAGGLYISKDAGRTFSLKSTIDGLGNMTINDIFVDSTNRFLVATEGGLSISTDGGESFTSYSMTDGLPHHNVLSVSANAAGDIFAATYGGGLSITTDAGATFTTKTTVDGLGSNQVRDLFVDSSNNIYAATNGGLSISLDGGASFTNYNSSNGLASNTVTSVFVDTSNVIYVSTLYSGIGISSNGGGNFITKGTSDGIGLDVEDIFVDNSGVIYIANSISSDAALSISIDSGVSFSSKGITNGLGGSLSSGVALDSSGRLYVAIRTFSSGDQSGGVFIRP
jgi:ligand-binding sensor domain-containing protein